MEKKYFPACKGCGNPTELGYAWCSTDCFRTTYKNVKPSHNVTYRLRRQLIRVCDRCHLEIPHGTMTCPECLPDAA